MSHIIELFKWLWSGVKQMFAWLTSIPAIIVGSVVGLVTAITDLVSGLSGASDSAVASAVDAASAPLDSIIQLIQAAPDIVKLAIYACGLDTLFRFVLAAFYLFVSGTVLVLEFQLVTILGFYAVVLGYKMVAWFINAFFPKSWAIGGVSSIASAEVPQIDAIDV